MEGMMENAHHPHGLLGLAHHEHYILYVKLMSFQVCLLSATLRHCGVVGFPQTKIRS